MALPCIFKGRVPCPIWNLVTVGVRECLLWKQKYSQVLCVSLPKKYPCLRRDRWLTMHSPVIHNLLYVDLLSIAFFSPSFPFPFPLPPSLGPLPSPSHSLPIPILLPLSHSTAAGPFLCFSCRHKPNCRSRGMSASVRWWGKPLRCCSCSSTFSLVLHISAVGKCPYSLLWFEVWMFFTPKHNFV